MIDRTKFRWHHGAAGAVSLTYDDALPCHFESVAPMIEVAQYLLQFENKQPQSADSSTGVVVQIGKI